MDPSTVSLSLVITLGVPRTWREAVAVVQDAGEAMALSGIAVRAEDCVITTRGTLEVVADEGEPHAGSSASLVDLLAALLDGRDAPGELHTLGIEARVRHSPDEFVRALTAFAPEDRRAAIAGLAARGIAARAEVPEAATSTYVTPAPAAVPAHVLAARAVMREAQTVMREAQKWAPRRWPTRRDLAAVAVLGILGAAALGVSLWAFRGRPSPLEAPAISEDDKISAGAPVQLQPMPLPPGRTPAVAPADISLSPTRGASPAPASAAAARAAAPAAAPPVAAVPSAPPEADAEPAMAPEDAAPNTPAPDRPAEAAVATAAEPATGESFLSTRPRSAEPLLQGPAVSVPAPPVAAPAPAAAPPDDQPSRMALDTVFDVSAPGVVPPVFVRRQLAESLAGERGGTTAYLVLLVGENGQVEQVRLEPANAQVRDRLLLPAAKAWQFRPATKDGRPVRYLLRVPVPAQR